MRFIRTLLARELDRDLQRDYGISKAEFSVLVTLHQTPGGRMRVAHRLTRMENRELVDRTENESSGRRAGIGLTEKGRRQLVRRAEARSGATADRTNSD